MGKILWHVTMSVDGFIAGPGDAMDWVFRHAGPNPVAEAVSGTIGAVLAGRRGYDASRRSGGELYGGAWSGPIFVLTHRPPPDRADPNITFLSGDIRSAVATALEAADGKDVLVAGADVARQCLAEGLVDELLIHVAPLLLGDGVRLFGRPGATPVTLETISVSQAGPVTNLRFHVVK